MAISHQRSKTLKTSHTGFGEDYVEKKRLSLLDLPTEIRVEILKLLLWQQAPIHNHGIHSRENNEKHFISKPNKNYDFHPAVLRVCRQLNEEGGQLLYENIPVMSLWQFNHEDNRISVLDQVEYNTSDDGIIRKFPRLQIEIYFWWYDYEESWCDIDESECHLLRELVSGLVHYHLMELSNHKQLSVKLMKGKRTYGDKNFNPIGENFLLPLVRICDLELVEFQGVSDHFAKGISLHMVPGSRRPWDFERMLPMLQHLENAAEGLHMAYYEVDEILEPARLAVCEIDREKFQHSKRLVIYHLIAFLCYHMGDQDKDASHLFSTVFTEFGQITSRERSNIMQCRLRDLDVW